MESFEQQLRSVLKQDDVLQITEEENFSAAAVLILLAKIGEKWHILFTHRTNEVRTHQGEVSFPGGAFEEGDEFLTHTALRETEEEIGIGSGKITILGGMEKYKTVTNFIVYPFVGIIGWPIEFHVNPNEVERVFLIPVEWLSDPNNFYEKEHLLNGSIFRRVIHYKDYEGEHLWGFTARLAQELLELIN